MAPDDSRIEEKAHCCAALARSRLSWVEQNYLRADTLTAANSRLVDAHTDIPLAQAWGSGQVASADGRRFVVPVRTLNAGPNPRYFGPGRGVTYLNFLSDQFSGFPVVVVPGTLREASTSWKGSSSNKPPCVRRS